MKNALLLIVCVLFFSCKTREAMDSNIRNLVIDLVGDSFYIDEAAYNEFHYIRLETTDECLLSEISKVVHFRNKIYVTSISEPTVFIFDEKGKFLSKISKGQGPGEVLFVSDIEIKDEKLYVLDMYKTLREYDLDGNYIQDVRKFDNNYFSFSFLPDGILLVDNNIDARSDFNICIESHNGDKGYALKKKKWSNRFAVATNGLLKENFLTWPLSDTIYHLNQETRELNPAFFVDFKDKSINSYKEDKPLTSADVHGKDNVYAWFIHNFILTDAGCFFSFKYKDVFYVKKESDLISIYSKMLDDMPSLGPSVGYEQGGLIYSVKAHELIDYKNSILRSETLPDIYNEDISETDNPFLIYVPIKREI